MQNAAMRDGAVPPEDRDEGFYLVVSDLVALIDRVQTSLKLIEVAKGQQRIGDQEYDDIVVLDDVTPLYTQAGAALDACNTSLSAALQFLIESTTLAAHA